MTPDPDNRFWQLKRAMWTAYRVTPPVRDVPKHEIPPPLTLTPEDRRWLKALRICAD